MGTLLNPPVCFPNLRCKLMTVSEGIDYIDLQVPERAQHHRLVEAAREALYRAEDTGAKSDAAVASAKLSKVLSVVEIGRH
jgi:hypothetical protein